MLMSLQKLYDSEMLTYPKDHFLIHKLERKDVAIVVDLYFFG